MSAAILSNEPQSLIFVSGNGDGGLVDFQMAVFNAMEHQAICEFLMGLDLGLAIAELQLIEQEAWQVGGETLDLLAEYRARVLPLILQRVWQLIIARLRP